MRVSVKGSIRGYIDEGQFAATRNTMAKFRGIELGLDNAIAYGSKPAVSGMFCVLSALMLLF